MQISPLSAPKYSIQSLYTALHHRQQSRTQLRCSRSYQEPTPCLCYPSSCLQTPPQLLPGIAHITQELRRLLVQGVCHKCHCLSGALICLQALLMDPSLVPSFRPVAAAIEGISPVGYVNVTVLGRMNLFGFHDMAVQLVAVWKNRFEYPTT